MAENGKEVKAVGKQDDHQDKDASVKLLDDAQLTSLMAADRNKSAASSSLDGLAQYSLGRRAIALAEGVTLIPHGVFNAANYNFEHPLEFAGKAATGLAFGVGLRVLLPKAGAASALVGTAMSYFMVRDAARPLYETWMDAGSATSMAGVHQAAQKMGDGLGMFAFDSGVAIGTGAIGSMGAGAVLEGTKGGRAFERWKDVQLNSDQTAIGRMFKWGERTADSATDIVAQRLSGKVSPADVTPLSEKLKLIQENQPRHAVETGAAEGSQADLYRLDDALKVKRRYKSPQFSENIDTLLGDRAEIASHGSAVKPIIIEGAGKADLTPGLPNQGSLGAVRRMRFAEGPESAGNSAGKAGKGGDVTVKPGDVTPKPADAPAPKGPAEMTGDVVGRMAIDVRAKAGAVTKEDMMVADAKETIEAPLTSTMRSGKAPLDQGHFSNNQMLLDLTQQIKTAEDYKQAGMLLDHFRTANSQLELSVKGDSNGMNAITDLNQYSRSIHSRLLGNLDKNGIPRSVVRGSNSPLFSIRDSDGAGPYTIPAIPKVTDAAVVTYPREYQGLEGVHTAGVYAHELGHDLIYGDLLRLPANLRDKVLTDNIVGAAMKKAGIADTDIPVPGSPKGTMKKSEFFVQLLKAEANENTADMFGTSIDPNTGLSLATLLASLRKAAPGSAKDAPGLLETRSMYGHEMVDADMGNHLGIEPHGIDRWRLKLAAETLRELSQGDKGVHEYAAGLDKLADTMSRPGSQYVWASMDQKGQFVSIPMKEWDAIIPALVKAQFETPLDALNGKTLKHVAPSMPDTFRRVDRLSGEIADSALKGDKFALPFQKEGYRVEEVFSSGLSAWMKAVAKNAPEGQASHVPPEVILDRINAISEGLRAYYRSDVPEASLAAPKAPVSLSDVALKPLSSLSVATGKVIAAQPRLRETIARHAPQIAAYAGSSLMQDLLDQKRLQDQMLKGTDK